MGRTFDVDDDRSAVAAVATASSPSFSLTICQYRLAFLCCGSNSNADRCQYVSSHIIDERTQQYRYQEHAWPRAISISAHTTRLSQPKPTFKTQRHSPTFQNRQLFTIHQHISYRCAALHCNYKRPRFICLKQQQFDDEQNTIALYFEIVHRFPIIWSLSVAGKQTSDTLPREQSYNNNKRQPAVMCCL